MTKRPLRSAEIAASICVEDLRRFARGRATFAVKVLRGGGSVFTLKEMLGYTDILMTSRYVAPAQADVQNQHRQFSPAEELAHQTGSPQRIWLGSIGRLP